MKEQIKNIELPFFAGFYESILFNYDTEDTAINDEIEYKKEYEGVETVYDDYEFDYDGYRNAIVKAFVEASKEVIDSCVPWITEIESPELVSPRYYNFETDKVYVTATLHEDYRNLIMDFFEKNAEWLKKRIKEDWSDRSGFWSFIENNYDGFVEHTMSLDARYISIITQYAIELYNETSWEDCFDVMNENTLYNFEEHNYIGEFVRYKKEKVETDNGNGTETTADSIREN